MGERSGIDRTEEGTRPQTGVWEKLRQGLRKSRLQITDRLQATWTGRGVLDEETLEALEESLIAADVGVAAATELIDRVRDSARRGEEGDLVRLRQLLADEIALLLVDAVQASVPDDPPAVDLIVGVNGSGKTTTIAKLTHHYQGRGETVLLVAADTFRAAATEQLVLWGERLGVDVIRQHRGADPAALVFDALEAARARGVDRVLVDTAGRLHTKQPLMAELEKIRRVVNREAADRRRRTLLVLDATTGQNAIAQATEFTRAVAVDGVVLAKLDGTAKGGMAVAVARELRLPILFLGVGETPPDLVEFRPREFAAALLG